MFGYDTLMNYFKVNFQLMKHHGYSLTELENMMPWEKMVYIQFLQEFLAVEEEKAVVKANQLRAQQKAHMRAPLARQSGKLIK